MSYILDALKKVEHEKIKKSAPGGMTSIAGDLFHEPAQLPARAGMWWKIIALLLVASLVTFVGTWFLLRGKKTEKAPISSPAAPGLSAPAVAPPAPAVVAPAPVQTPIVPAPPANVSAAPVSPSAVAPEDGDGDLRSTRRAKRSPVQAVPPAAPIQMKPAMQSVPAPTDIKLSGIAWQEQRSARRAVINGFLLKEGAVVSGARVSEIMPDRVLFTGPTGRFELRLDSAAVGEVRR